MNNKPNAYPRYFLGIESSCDDTGVAILLNGKDVVANELLSQTPYHEIFNGVVPEIASRKHFECLHLLLDVALRKAGCSFSDLCGIAATIGPGLIGSLLVGVATAKAIALSQGIPFFPVNHLLGHVFANFLSEPLLLPPFVILLVSGGHTEIYYMASFEKIERMGGTLDDAAGEAFDKGARILRLSYPGGPAISKISLEGNPTAIRFPKAFQNDLSFDFSFSGVKTALLYFMKRNPEFLVADAAASYQEAIVDILLQKIFLAARKKNTQKIVFAGGVSANHRLREKAKEKSIKWGYDIIFPSLETCTDNAAMIAKAGWFYYDRGINIQPDARVNASLSIEETMRVLFEQSTPEEASEEQNCAPK